MFDNAADVASAAADENCVRFRQVAPSFGSLAEYGRQIWHVKSLGVLRDQFVIFRFHFDRKSTAAGGDLGRFDGDATTARADIPHDAGRTKVELSEGNASHFGGRHQTVLRLGLQKRIVRVAEQSASRHFARPIRNVRLAHQDHYVQRRKILLSHFGEFRVRDAFIGRAEVLTNVSRKITDPAR